MGASSTDQLKSKIDPLHVAFTYNKQVTFDFERKDPPVAIISFYLQV